VPQTEQNRKIYKKEKSNFGYHTDAEKNILMIFFLCALCSPFRRDFFSSLLRNKKKNEKKRKRERKKINIWVGRHIKLLRWFVCDLMSSWQRINKDSHKSQALGPEMAEEREYFALPELQKINFNSLNMKCSSAVFIARKCSRGWIVKELAVNLML
jgi:hypothetical protein